MRLICLAILLSTGLAGMVMAQSRVALVIGNSAYEHSTPLPNPTNDARAVADKLTSIGFDVMLREDLGGQAFRVALGKFTEKALRADLAVVFYAGHGIELSGDNYMIPVDAKMRSEATAIFEAVKLDAMLTPVRQAGKLGMVLIDACRDNPYATTIERRNGTRSVRRGLAPITLEGESGLIVSFAAEAGSTADDGAGDHSPYTEALLEVLDEPGLEVGRMFRKMRARVRASTDGKQVPIERMQLPDEEIYLVGLPDDGGGGGGDGPDADLPGDDRPEAPSRPPAVEDPLIAYINAVAGGEKEDLEDFIQRYPDHPKAKDARKLLLDMADTDYWERTVAQDTEDAYRTYLIVFPDGRFADEAKARLAAYNQPPVEEAPAPPRHDPGPPVSQYSCPALDGQWSVTGVAANDTLFVRSGSSGNATAIGELPFNADGVRVHSCDSKGWCSLTYGCIDGYAYGRKYLKQARGGHSGSQFQGYYAVVDVASHDKLNLRSGPGVSKYGNEYGVVADIPHNAEGVYVFDCEKKNNYKYSWCAVQWQNVSGWAYGRYLSNGMGQRPGPGGLIGATRGSSGPTCDDLWYERNAIYDSYGYCFKSSRGKNTFNNADCHTSNPSLSRADTARVSEIKRLEGRMGC